MATTYHVKDMRILDGNDSGIAFVIKGIFTEHTVDANGKATAGKMLKSNSKSITNDMAAAKDFSIDYDKHIVTLPSAKRGRPVVNGLDKATVTAKLNALRSTK